MKETVLLFGGVFGSLAVIFGAFGAHALKSKFDTNQQKSFETGVKYQMYHALLLIFSGVIFPFLEPSQVIMGWSFILGIFLFSFSIYGLCITGTRGRKWKFLGPVTPLGGLLLLFGWILLTYNLTKYAAYL